MDKLFEHINFLLGTLGACALVLTGFIVIRSFLKFFDDNEKDKIIKELRKEIKDLNYRLETKTEWDRLRYYQEQLTKKK